jgi:hypothetical protein
MRSIVTFFLCYSFLSIAYADGQFSGSKMRVKGKRPLTLLNPLKEKIPFESIKFDFKKITREELLIRLSSGGDDVGNGGDEIRRQILNEIDHIKKEVGAAYNIPDLSTKGLVVVDKLELNGKSYPAINTTKGIVINRKGWINLMVNHIDIRILLLNLLLIEDQTDQKALMIYSILSRQGEKTPYCSETIPSHLLIKTSQTKTFRGEESSELLSSKALNECQNTTLLFECRILETGKKGLANWAKNFATYQGVEYSSKKLNRSEKKDKACQLAKSCELTYELAPIGQVSLEAFSEVDSRIEKFCF